MFEARYTLLLEAIRHSFRYSHTLAESYPFNCLFSIFYILSMLLRYLTTRSDKKVSLAYHVFLLIQVLGYIGFAGLIVLDE